MPDQPQYAHPPGVAKHPDFARRLSAAMDHAGLPQSRREDWIAELTQMTAFQAMGYLRGDYLPPEHRVLSIADALGVSPTWLRSEAGPMLSKALSSSPGPLSAVEPMVLRWVPEREAKPSSFDLGAQAVPYEAYRSLEDRHHAMAARLLRAETALAEAAPAFDTGPRDPIGWSGRLHQLVDTALACDQSREDDDALKAINESLAILKAWKDSFA